MTVRARKLGLRVAALAATALVLTACNDDDAATTGMPSHAAASPTASASSSGKAKAPATTGKPSSAGSAAADPAAQAKMAKLALTAQEWDRAFVADGDDGTARDNYVMDKACKYAPDGTSVKGLTASVSRFVRQDHESDTTFANTNASKFTTADAAHQDLMQTEADVKRCENYTDTESKAEITSAHEAESPAVPGADEVYSEEGLAVYPTTDGGRTDQRPYTYIVARKGTVLVSVLVDGDPQRQGFEGRALAREALQKLTAKW